MSSPIQPEQNFEPQPHQNPTQNFEPLPEVLDHNPEYLEKRFRTLSCLIILILITTLTTVKKKL